MNDFLRHGITEYRNQYRREQQFNGYARRIRNLLQLSGPRTDDDYLLMLTPMIEVAWVDGKIGRPEQNAILKAAESYGLLRDDATFVQILERLSTRPLSTTIEHWWSSIADMLYVLPVGQIAAISSLMLAQTRYVAGLGQKQIFGQWRGHSSGKDEEIKLEETKKRLSSLETNRSEPIHKVEKGNATDHLKLAALVKVAWADGRITKRERQLIFDSLFDLGIDPNNENLDQLLHWLELSPKEDFFRESLEKLKAGLDTLDADQRAKEKYSLISQCTLLAEVSGGDSNSPGGGARICDEEITAVKQIAKILNGAITRN